MKNIKEKIINFLLSIAGIIFLGIIILGGLLFLSYFFSGQLADSLKQMY